jgi:flagellar export protein FliJ
MKRYQFRLDTVLRVRRVEEDRAIAALAAARRKLDAAEATLQDTLDRYSTVPEPSGPMSVIELLRARAHQELVAASVVHAGAERLRAEAVVELQRKEWSAAAQRVAALERLDERRREEHAVEAQRQETIEVDDMVVGRAGR